jgi:cobalamin biosynthetic protein CobC
MIWMAIFRWERSPMPEHGGQLRRAAQRYGRPIESWLDLSTGVNPSRWRAELVFDDAWSRLPENNDGLEEAAREYYGAPAALPTAGTQAAILNLPRLRPKCRVGVLDPTYFEHPLRWQEARHEVVPLTAGECEDAIETLNVLVIVNPNNPTGERFARSVLLRWHARLAARGGWLVVDEAFADVSPQDSLAEMSDRPGLIVLRSLGKFFGLPGARVGFVLSAPDILAALASRLGPWTVSGPSRLIASQALQDRAWQDSTRVRLRSEAIRLSELLEAHGLRPTGGCELFQWRRTDQAPRIYEALAGAGILTRLFESPASLRFGLPGREENWQRLEAALRALPSEACR